MCEMVIFVTLMSSTPIAGGVVDASAFAWQREKEREKAAARMAARSLLPAPSSSMPGASGSGQAGDGRGEDAQPIEIPKSMQDGFKALIAQAKVRRCRGGWVVGRLHAVMDRTGRGGGWGGEKPCQFFFTLPILAVFTLHFNLVVLNRRWALYPQATRKRKASSGAGADPDVASKKVRSCQESDGRDSSVANGASLGPGTDGPIASSAPVKPPGLLTPKPTDGGMSGGSMGILGSSAVGDVSDVVETRVSACCSRGRSMSEHG